MSDAEYGEVGAKEMTNCIKFTTKTAAEITIFCRYIHTFLVQGNRDQAKAAAISENPL